MTQQQDERIRELTQDACDMGHVIIESGYRPGIDGPCRCEECRRVAVGMHDTGFLEDVPPEDRWWLEPEPTTETP